MFALNILPAQSAPKVVVSISPIHALTAQVMAGIAKPKLLLKGNIDPHSHSLKPSQVMALNQADLIIVVAPNLETFLAKTLAELSQKKQILTLSAQPGMILHKARTRADWGNEKHGERNNHGSLDPHLWLDPGNAKTIVRALIKTLRALDQPNAARYSANGKQALMKLEALDNKLRAILQNIRKTPYLVFHDGYHYFEAHYGLNAVGALTLSPEHKPGARRLRQIRKTIKQKNIKCVFAEPQLSSRLIATVIENTKARAGVLDPLGTSLKPGPKAYSEMMVNLATSLKSCLSR
jgi:zinc transport system substrate-binding protein